MRLEMLWDLHGEDRDIVDQQNFLGNIEVPWDTQYDYKPIDFRSPLESSEDSHTHMNQIFADLFAIERFKKKYFSFKKKTMKTHGRVVKKIKQITNKDKKDSEKIQNILIIQ